LIVFKNGKIKKEPKNLELDINVAKKRAIMRFSAASSKFRGKWQIQWRDRILVALIITSCQPQRAMTSSILR